MAIAFHRIGRFKRWIKNSIANFFRGLKDGLVRAIRGPRGGSGGGSGGADIIALEVTDEKDFQVIDFLHTPWFVTLGLKFRLQRVWLLLSNALTIKGQNIGASTKNVCKQISYFDTLDNAEWKCRSFESFKNHAFASDTIDNWVEVHKKWGMIFKIFFFFQNLCNSFAQKSS